MAEAWADFYVVAGASAAVLLGLLFIALSINREPIGAEPVLAGQARAAIIGLIAVFLVSLAVLIPDQSHTALGAELLATGLIVFANAVPRQVWRVRTVTGAARNDYLVRSLIFDGAALLVAAAGGSLIADYADALYLLAAGVIALVLLAIANTWRLTLIGVDVP